MEEPRFIDTEIRLQIDEDIKKLYPQINKVGIRGVIIVDPEPEYTQCIREKLHKLGFITLEEKDKKLYGNGQGWYGLSVRNISQYVKFVKCRAQREAYLSRFNINVKPDGSLESALRSLVYDSINCYSRERLEKGVRLKGSKHKDLIREAFETEGIPTVDYDALIFSREHMADRLKVDLDEYFRIWKV